MTQDEARMVLEALGSRPGLAVQCTNVQAAQSIVKTEAKSLGLDITCIKSLSPMEFYVLAKQHPAVAGVYRGRGLPATEVARLQLQGNEQDRPSADQSVSGESASPGPAPNGSIPGGEH